MKKILLGLLICIMFSYLIPVSKVNASTASTPEEIKQQWEKTKIKYTKSANSIISYCDKLIINVNKLTLLSSEGKNTFGDKIETDIKNKAIDFKTALSKEEIPADPKIRQKELSESIKLFKADLRKKNTTFSYLRTFERILIYCNKHIEKISNSTLIPKDPKEALLTKYNLTKNKAKEYLEKIAITETTIEFTQATKTYLKEIKQEIKNNDKKFNIELAIGKFTKSIDTLRVIFEKLESCTNDALKQEIRENLDKRQEQLNTLKETNSSDNYTEAKIKIKEIQKNLKLDINLIKNLAKTCTSTN